jgi:hypothetical protein
MAPEEAGTLRMGAPPANLDGSSMFDVEQQKLHEERGKQLNIRRFCLESPQSELQGDVSSVSLSLIERDDLSRLTCNSRHPNFGCTASRKLASAESQLV